MLTELGGQPIDLVALAAEICERYHAHYTDEAERHGPAGRAWCRHDNQWLLSWEVGDVRGVTDLDEQACWLARVLHARDVPVSASRTTCGWPVRSRARMSVVTRARPSTKSCGGRRSQCRPWRSPASRDTFQKIGHLTDDRTAIGCRE